VEGCEEDGEGEVELIGVKDEPVGRAKSKKQKRVVRKRQP
jgi:hypothetical protein